MLHETRLEEINGNEVVFEHERQAADPSAIELCLELTARSRRDLTDAFLRRLAANLIAHRALSLDFDEPGARCERTRRHIGISSM